MAFQLNRDLVGQIIDSLKTICDHDINFIDENGNIYASTDPIRVGDYHEGGFRAAQTGEIVRITEDQPDSDMRKGINMPVRHHGKTLAVIGITGEPEEVERYAALIRRIALLLIREHDIDIRDRAAGRQTDYLVRALIFKERLDAEYRDYVLGLHGITSVAGRWRTVVFDTGRQNNTGRQTAANRQNDAGRQTAAGRQNTSAKNPFRPDHYEAEDTIAETLQTLADQMENCLFTHLPPYLYVMITKEETIRRHAAEFDNLAAAFSERITIGIGSAETFSRQSRSYENARLAAGSSREYGRPVWIEDLDIEVLLHMVPKAAADYFVLKTLGELKEEDLDLLRTYYACNMSLQETADRLFLHKNTLQYRLNRIRKITGKDPRIFKDAAVLYTSLSLK